MSLINKRNYQHEMPVIKSDTVEIPYPPNFIGSGLTSSADNNKLISIFELPDIYDSIQVGDIVINNTTSAIAYVTGVDPSDITTIFISSNIFTDVFGGEEFSIYKSMGNSGITYDAPVLYVESKTPSHSISVLTAGGQTVTFNNVLNGVFPVQVKRVNATGSTALTTVIALW